MRRRHHRRDDGVSGFARSREAGSLISWGFIFFVASFLLPFSSQTLIFVRILGFGIIIFGFSNTEIAQGYKRRNKTMFRVVVAIVLILVVYWSLKTFNPEVLDSIIPKNSGVPERKVIKVLE